MNNPGIGLLTLWGTSVLVSLVVPFFQDRLRLKLNWNWLSARHYVSFLAPLLLLIWAGQMKDLWGMAELVCFAAGSAVPFMVARLGLPARLNGLVLLMLAVLSSGWLNVQLGGTPMVFLIAGLTVWKSLEIWFFGVDAVFEDVLPPLIWLVGDYWISLLEPGTAASIWVNPRMGILLSSLAVTLSLRLVQGPYWFNDRLFLKRLMLSAIGGLGLLIVITKLLVVPNWALLSGMVGLGIFGAYVIDDIEHHNEGCLNLVAVIKVLIVVGMLTLLASRLWGMFGLLVLAPCALVSRRSSLVLYAGMFWVSRSLLQAYILQYNPNVTGVNLTHAYAGAALYAGMLFMLLSSLSLRDLKQPWLIAILGLGGSTLIPIFFNYFLHEEATASLLISLTMASVLLTISASSIYQKSSTVQSSMMLLPLLMTATALTSQELISWGNQSNLTIKLSVLGGGGGVLLLASCWLWWLSTARQRKSV